MNENRLASAPLDVIDEGARAAAIARLTHVFSQEGLSFESFSEVLDRIFTARSHAALEMAMSALPPLVRLTPVARRLCEPLVLRAPDGKLGLGSGWQLAADTAICTGFGTALVDLTTASWDAHHINLRLETWGSIDVLVPEGVDVQVAGVCASVDRASLAAAIPGGPRLRISTYGPTGRIRIRHPKQRNGGRFGRRARRRTAVG
jgi:hypothetical protein